MRFEVRTTARHQRRASGMSTSARNDSAEHNEYLRAEIISIASEILFNIGYEGTTTDLIASHCKISKTTLYKIFNNKNDLIAEIVELNGRNIVDVSRASDGDTPFLALCKIFGLLDDDTTYGRRLSMVRLITVEAARFPALGVLLKERGVLKLRKQLSTWLAAQESNGKLRFENPDVTARALMDIVFGSLFFEAAGDTGKIEVTEERKHAMSCVRMLLEGITP